MLPHVTPVETDQTTIGQYRGAIPHALYDWTPELDYREYRSLRALQAAAPFPLLIPGWLPDDCAWQTFAFRTQQGQDTTSGIAELSSNDWGLCLFQFIASARHTPPVGMGAVDIIPLDGGPALYIEGNWTVEPGLRSIWVYRHLSLENQTAMMPCRWQKGDQKTVYLERDGRIVCLMATAGAYRAADGARVIRPHWTGRR